MLLQVSNQMTLKITCFKTVIRTDEDHAEKLRKAMKLDFSPFKP